MIVWRGPSRIAHWASFLVFFAAFGLWTFLASEVSKDPAWPATALGIVALLVVVVLALAWARRGAVKSEGSSLFPGFDAVPSWVGLALALIGFGCVAAGAYSYYVHDREFWVAVQFYVVGFGAMALSQALPRFRRPSARD